MPVRISKNRVALENIPLNESLGASIASASTINLTTATGNTVHITGTTSITTVTLGAGMIRDVIFDGILTLTHHATTNNLPGGANITTAANDRARYIGDGTTVYCVNYQKADGTAVVGASGTTVSASGSITVDSTYNRKTIYATASITVTMPAVTSLADGFEVTIINVSTALVTINRTGSDEFELVGGDNTFLTSVKLPGTPNYNYISFKGNAGVSGNRWLVTSHRIESWSGDITPAQSTVHTFAHGLGVKPTRWRATAKCTTATLNYSVGDEIEVTSGANSAGSLLSLYADATNIGLVLGGGWPPAFNKTTTGGSTIDGTNWRFVLKAEI